MNITILGAAGFIGTNLLIELAKKPENNITAIDKNLTYFSHLKKLELANVLFKESPFLVDSDYDSLVSDSDIVYHLISTTVPTTSNQHISQELQSNIILSSNLFEACVRKKVKKVVFISSGGTVYGKEHNCPLNEDTPTNPITAYGVQKITIEKLLYLYKYMYNLDYRIIRLANPYGPYQRPNGILGAVTTFIYKALMGESIDIYGDGSVVRDFIFIDDVIRALQKIVNGEEMYRTYNLGCGYGTSIKQVVNCIQKTLNIDLKINYKEARKVDVPVNYLDIHRYETAFGSLNPTSLEDGILQTANFMRNFYSL